MFKINQVCYDSENKEYIKISNGIEKDGKLIPTEAIAFRPVPIRFKNNEFDKILIGFTYRRVNPEKLSVCDDFQGLI